MKLISRQAVYLPSSVFPPDLSIKTERKEIPHLITALLIFALIIIINNLTYILVCLHNT